MTKIKYFKKKLSAVIILLISINQLSAQTFNPFSYYTFDNTPVLKDEMNNGNLDPNYFASSYFIGAPQSNLGVGSYLTLTPSSTIIKGSQFVPDSGLTIEFLFRPGYNFDGQDIMWSQNGGFQIRMGYPYIKFYTNTYTANNVKVFDEFNIDLEDIGRKSYGYYVDNKWHHMVFKMNAKTGVKQIWVDGESPVGFTKTISTPNTKFKASTYNSLYLTTNTNYLSYDGDIDEIAVYTYDLHPNMVYKHYQNFVNHAHYSFTWTNVAPPPPTSLVGTIDIMEYAPGHPTPTVDMMEQIANFPAARIREGSTLLPNGTLTNHAYTGGRFWPGITDAKAVANSVEIQKQLFKNFNYAIQVSGATTEWAQFGDTTKFSGAWIKLANDNPTIPTTISTSWPHVIPSMAGFASSENYVTCRCLPNSSYLQNAAGDFIDNTGAVSIWKTLAPDAPLDSIKQDGLTQKFYFTKLFQKLTRPLNFILDEAENLPTLRTVHAGPLLDASVVAKKNASGLDWYTYFGRNYNLQAKAYRDNFMNLPQLANTKYQLYETEGHDDYRPKYTEIRTINSNTNGKYYPVASMYTRFPSNWRYNSSAWNGWQWFVESRVNEIAAGDNYCAPATAAGWDENEENNIRPAQWLGLNKAMAMAGAEYFFPAFFVLGGQTLQNPSNYIWQLTTPGYVQGTTSFYEDLFKNGKLMAGDVPLISTNPNGQMGYSFKAGDQRKLVVVRKHNTLSRYAITGTIQPSNNIKGSAEIEANAQINLDGQTLKFKIRRQGSTYVYDKTNVNAPVFYQLDGWHEATHPYYWSKDFSFEGELFEIANTNLTIKTSVPAGTTPGDFTDFTSYVGFNSGATATYNFTVRGDVPQTYYFWVCARAKLGTTSVQVKLDNGSLITINNMTTGWKWYRINSATNKPIDFKNLNVGNHALKLTAGNSNLEVDKIYLSTTPADIFGTTGIAVSDSIIVLGSINLCQGETVTLNCDTAGTTFLWSNGATLSSIIVGTSGQYYATITNNVGNKTQTDTVTVAVNNAPSASITVVGPTNLCFPDKATLTANNAFQYLWSTGETTQSISVTNAGTYSLTTSNKKGCTTLATPVSFTANGCCPLPNNLSAINITSTSAKFKWQAASNPSNYEISYTRVGGTTLTVVNNGVSKNYTVTNLKPGKTYKWSVRSLCGTSNSNNSDTLTFTTPLPRIGETTTADEASTTLFPNPTNDVAYITFSSEINANYSVNVFNNQGQKVLSQQGSATMGLNTINLNLERCSAGFYTVELIVDNELTQRLKLIKQ